MTSMTSTTVEIQRYPASESSGISWRCGDSISEHTVKLSISVDYRLVAVPKTQDEINRKYYITYSLGGHIEGKSEILTVGDQTWLLQQDVIVNKELLINLYQSPSEIVLWEITNVPKEVRKKKKEVEGGTGTTQTNLANQANRKESVKSPAATIQISLANTGLVKKKLKLKTQGKFLPSHVIRKTAESQFDEDLLPDPLMLRKRSSSSPNLGGSDSDEWKKRPGSGSSILSRPASSSYGTIESSTGPSGHSRTFPHPHHFDHPEKHVDGTLIRTGIVRSRSSSLTNIMRSDRPRTPPSPHHHDHPLKTIKKEDARSVAKIKTASSHQTRAQSPLGKKANVRWGGSASPKSSAHWDQASIANSLRLENDHQILRGHLQLLEKRKGDSLHTPLEQVIFDISPLFLGELEIQGTIKSCRQQLSDSIFKISLDSKLLSLEQKESLNPLVVTLGVAEGMPDKPVPFKVLDSATRPIYATFKFFNDPFYHTAVLHNQNHASSLNFQSKHVILPGLLDSKRLQDEMKQSSLLVEIHDRDYKYSKELAEKNSRFFEGGVIQTNLNPISPYGQALFDLKEIGNGNRQGKYETTILPSPREERQLTRGSLLQGDYFSMSSIFSIEVEVQNSLSPEPLAEAAQFSTLTIYCKNDVSYTSKILDFIWDYNCTSLQLEINEGHQKESVLCSHVISKENEVIDILHGYHIYDAENNLLFIEGDSSKGISALESFLLSFDGNCLFSRNDAMFYRQKPLTSPSLMHLQLEPTISTICTWTKSSVITNRTFASINYLNQIITAKADVWKKRNPFLFPSQKTILPLLQGYASVKTGSEIRHVLERLVNEGTKVTREERAISGEDHAPVQDLFELKPVGKKIAIHKIDSANTKHNSLLKLRKNREPYFVSINSKRYFTYSPTFTASTDISVFNYSIQKHSSTQKQIKDLRIKLKQDKSSILAFAGDFLSSVPLT